MSHLRLVQSSHLSPSELFRQLEEIVGIGADVSIRTYSPKRLPLIEISEGEEYIIRIVFDLNGLHKDRQGIHTCYPEEASNLITLIEDATKDGFDTIWIH